MGQTPPVVDVVTKRYEFLVALSTPKTKPELVASLDRSRSTVDRAVGALRDADLVERTGSEYVVTYAGRQATAAYEAFRDRLDALQRPRRDRLVRRDHLTEVHRCRLDGRPRLL